MAIRYKSARDILAAEIAKFDGRIDLIMERHSGPLIEARDRAWWMHIADDKESPTTDRNRAYLRAYCKISTPLPLFAEGLSLEDRGRIYMDRSVMRRLLIGGLVTFVEGRAPYFELTEAGEAFVAE